MQFFTYIYIYRYKGPGCIYFLRFFLLYFSMNMTKQYLHKKVIIFYFWCFNSTFSNISAISWQPVLVVEEARVPARRRHYTNRYDKYRIMSVLKVETDIITSITASLIGWSVIMYIEAGFGMNALIPTKLICLENIALQQVTNDNSLQSTVQ
jgi:hypothetical protein